MSDIVEEFIFLTQSLVAATSQTFSRSPSLRASLLDIEHKRVRTEHTDNAMAHVLWKWPNGQTATTRTEFEVIKNWETRDEAEADAKHNNNNNQYSNGFKNTHMISTLVLRCMSKEENQYIRKIDSFLSSPKNISMINLKPITFRCVGRQGAQHSKRSNDENQLFFYLLFVRNDGEKYLAWSKRKQKTSSNQKIGGIRLIFPSSSCFVHLCLRVFFRLRQFCFFESVHNTLHMHIMPHCLHTHTW